MKKLLILTLAAFALGGCNSAAQPPTTTANADQSSNANRTMPKPNGDAPVVSSHSSGETVSPNQSNKTASTESPMARPIDVAEMTADIEKAEKEFKKSPKDEKAKSELAKAYFVRATALTDAAQYRAALGDYRKGLKLNANDEEAKQMHDMIINIFKNNVRREPPKEGEEPAPMPFGK